MISEEKSEVIIILFLYRLSGSFQVFSLFLIFDNLNMLICDMLTFNMLSILQSSWFHDCLTLMGKFSVVIVSNISLFLSSFSLYSCYAHVTPFIFFPQSLNSLLCFLQSLSEILSSAVSDILIGSSKAFFIFCYSVLVFFRL